MMNLSAITLKMVDFYKGNREDIRHFIKVHAFARTIGMAERLDKRTQDTLEVAAIVHDIACPLCREKYGDTNGDHQEAESEALLRPFLEEFNLPKEMEERVIFIVTHHHTYVNVEGRDWQILLEADYLVNADESEKYMKGFDGFREKVFKTETGKHLLASMYPEKMK
ncbi:MAG: HD domain-containing protein [Selenomonadaceae bacterium]